MCGFTTRCRFAVLSHLDSFCLLGTNFCIVVPMGIEVSQPRASVIVLAGVSLTYVFAVGLGFRTAMLSVAGSVHGNNFGQWYRGEWKAHPKVVLSLLCLLWFLHRNRNIERPSRRTPDSYGPYRGSGAGAERGASRGGYASAPYSATVRICVHFVSIIGKSRVRSRHLSSMGWSMSQNGYICVYWLWTGPYSWPVHARRERATP